MLHILNRQSQLVRISLIIMCVIGAGVMMIWSKPVVCPLVCAMLLSISLLPVARFIERRIPFGRGFASFLTALLFFGLIALILYIVSRQVTVIDWTGFKQQLIKSFDSLSAWFLDKYNLDIHGQMQQLRQNMLASASRMTQATIMSFSAFLLFMALIILNTFFLLLYRRRIVIFLLSVVRPENRPVLTSMVNRIQLTVRSYLVGISMEMLIVSVLACVAFKLTGVPYFMFMGLLTGVFNIIPYAGILTALIINAIITFGVGGIDKVFWLAGATFVIHLLDSNVILPFIVGAKVKLNALVVVVGLALGEMIWQIPGMFLATPIIGIIKIISDNVQGFKPLGILLGGGKALEI